MALKDILVQIDDSKQCAARLSLAASLARDCGARLTGLYVITHQVYAPQNEAKRLMAAEAKERFSRQTAEAGVSAEWIVADWGTIGVNQAEVFNFYAHAKDLVIVGQSDPASPEGEATADLPERLIAGSGRPVLVVPYAGSFATPGRRVVVAWKTGRESARAVNDAMHFLLAADLVSVVAIESPGDRSGTFRTPPVDICAHLERHEVRLRKETLLTGKIPVATLLMAYAWENGCDLVVMGVPRMGNKIAPVAREMLDRMTVPVLMAY